LAVEYAARPGLARGPVFGDRSSCAISASTCGRGTSAYPSTPSPPPPWFPWPRTTCLGPRSNRRQLVNCSPTLIGAWKWRHRSRRAPARSRRATGPCRGVAHGRYDSLV